MPTYTIGDATKPTGPGTKVICHCVNDAGRWGSGFVLSLGRYPKVEQEYRQWARTGVSAIEVHLLPGTSMGLTTSFTLGSVQFVQVSADTWVANLVGQHRTIRMGEAIPVRYEALKTGFELVGAFCNKYEASLHMPRLGAGLAKGSWSKIEGILDCMLIARGISGTVYDLV